MSDEKELKEELDFSSEEVKKVVKKAKLFTVLRNVVIILVVLAILSIAVFISNSLILHRMANNVMRDEYIFNEVARPNNYISQWQSNDGFWWVNWNLLLIGLLGTGLFIMELIILNTEFFLLYPVFTGIQPSDN